jgi:transcriptional regulator of acetoin/glycerol metabolism
MRMSAPILDSLFQMVGRSGCCVLLADSEGLPLERRGAPQDDPDFAGWGLWPGALWSEAAQGTNGIGTCLIEERPVTIHRDQHFLIRNTRLSCMSAPIFDPAGGLHGVLDVSSARADLTEAMTALVAHAVADAARRIEAELFRASFPRARIVVLGGAGASPEAALLAVDEDGLVIGATRGARTRLRLSGDLVQQPVPFDDLVGVERPDSLEAASRAVLRRALARAGGNASAAARALGISRATFHRRLGSRTR